MTASSTWGPVPPHPLHLEASALASCRCPLPPPRRRQYFIKAMCRRTYLIRKNYLNLNNKKFSILKELNQIFQNSYQLNFKNITHELIQIMM